jgi:hypothetical protein
LPPEPTSKTMALEGIRVVIRRKDHLTF